MLKKVLFISCLLMSLCAVSFAAAAEQPLNTVKAFAADAGSQYMVSSPDGTSIDIFYLQSQTLVENIKLPASTSGDMQIKALAINPDNYIIAAAGTNLNGAGKAAPVYLFNIEPAKLYGRISNLPAAVSRLTYSKNGKYLVVGLMEKSGIRIYQMHDLKVTTLLSLPDMTPEEKYNLNKMINTQETLIVPNLFALDKEYAGDITALDFDRNGRLVVCSSDGLIRLYNEDFKLSKKVTAKSGTKPSSASFSPDNAKIVVTFADTAAIYALPSGDLAYLYSPDTQSFAGGSITASTWSSDGKILYTSGLYKGNTDAAICGWKGGGTRSCSAIGSTSGTLNDLTPLKGGGVAYVDSASRIEMLDKRYGTIKNERANIWVAVGPKLGNVTYQIGGHVNDYANHTAWEQIFPTSELKWPIFAIMGEVGGELRLGKRFELRGSIAHNITSNIHSKMEDSDWIYNTTTPDIYSESDASFQGYVLDGGVRYWFLDRQAKENSSYAVGVGLGFMYQKYNWDASDLDQWYPTTPGSGHDYVNGLVGSYQSITKMPYIELIFKSKMQNFDLGGSIGVAPYMWVSDEDNHRLRAFIATSDTHGYGLKASLNGNYNFTTNIFAGLRFNLLFFDTKGVSTTRGYAGASANDYYDIENKIKSLQMDLMLTVGYRF